MRAFTIYNILIAYLLQIFEFEYEHINLRLVFSPLHSFSHGLVCRHDRLRATSQSEGVVSAAVRTAHLRCVLGMNYKLNLHYSWSAILCLETQQTDCVYIYEEIYELV